MPPRHQSHSTKPSYNVTLAEAIFGHDIIVVTEAQAYPGFDSGEDPTAEEEEQLVIWRAETMPQTKVLKRAEHLIKAVGDLAEVATLIGSSGLDSATGCWSNDLPAGGVDVMEDLVEYLKRVKAEVARRTLLLDACYRRDPAFNQPD